jgi:hypothetical protein
VALDRETRPRQWRLGVEVQRGVGGGTRLGVLDDGEVDTVVALGGPSSAMPRLGTHNEEAVRVTNQRQHQGRRRGSAAHRQRGRCQQLTGRWSAAVALSGDLRIGRERME